jgi:hypothetical protein
MKFMNSLIINDFHIFSLVFLYAIFLYSLRLICVCMILGKKNNENQRLVLE